MSRPGGIAAPLTILIVDRSSMLRAMLKRVLQLSGVPIAAILDAPGRTDALDALARVPVDALFVGVDLPEDEGLELLRTVRSHDEWRDVVCVAIGAHPSAAVSNQSSLRLRGALETPFTVIRIRELLWDLIGSDEAPATTEGSTYGG